MISPLDNLDVVTARQFGGKAEGLAHLRNAGAPIPETLCVSTGSSDIDKLRRNKSIISVINRWLKNLRGSNFIVRSSHYNEDSMITSNAGIYASRTISIENSNAAATVLDTVLDLMPPNVESEGVKPGAAFLIQPYIHGVLSGVLFTSDPNIGLISDGLVTLVEGTCSALVDGSAQPETINFSHGVYSGELPANSAEQMQALLSYSKVVEEEWGVPIDVEFTIDNDGELFLLQARPIAALTKWKGPQLPLLVSADTNLPPSVITHSKVQLRLLCEEQNVPISRAWIVTETVWDRLKQLGLPTNSYASVLVHPALVGGKIHRMFSRDAFSGVSHVLNAAKDYWVRHAIVKEILASELTGIAVQTGERVLVEVAKGHFVPKGVVDTCIYEVVDGNSRLIREQPQAWYFDIDLDTGEATKHEWGGYPSLTHKQIEDVADFCRKLQLHPGDYLEFGVNAGGEIFVIDTQGGKDHESEVTANDQVLSLGQAEGILRYISTNVTDATEAHFLNFVSGQARNPSAHQPVIIASRRPELGLLTEFATISEMGMQIVGAIFEVYSPLCHLAVLLREWGIPAVVVPDFTERALPEGTTIRITATTSGGGVEAVS